MRGIFNDKFYRGSVPSSASDREDWLAHATEIGARGLNAFQHLFFDHQGKLYGVKGGAFYKGNPPTYSHDMYSWLRSAELLGTSGWSIFKFLFFDPFGFLYGVPVDDIAALLKGFPPLCPSYNWYEEGFYTRWLGSAWDQYDHLLFMADGYLYGVKGGEFFKYSVIVWVKEFGTAGWSDFKFLMAPLAHQ